MQGTSGSQISVRRVGIEAFFLILAVLFALAVDEAWEDHENSEAAAQALSRIHRELDKNRKLIRSENDQHKLELERLQPLIAQLDAGRSFPDDFDANVQIQLSILRDTAWRSAQFADVLKYLPSEEIERVTSAYSLQEVYKEQTTQVFNFQSDIKFIEATSAVQLRSSFQILSKLYAIETTLLSAYEHIQAPAETESAEQ